MYVNQKKPVSGRAAESGSQNSTHQSYMTPTEGKAMSNTDAMWLWVAVSIHQHTTKPIGQTKTAEILLADKIRFWHQK